MPLPPKTRRGEPEPAVSVDRKNRRDREPTSPFKIVPLPCLRCGDLTVPVAPLFLLVGRGASTFPCQSCEAQHYLGIARDGNAFTVCYQRYTLRYPLEFYDEGDPPIARCHVDGQSGDESDDEVFAGPIMVYPRKRRFLRSEVVAIWQATKGRCHICNQRWRVDQRGADGWHIDHVVPHVGGGRDTEEMPNFRVACGICNLKKGKGYTEASIRLGLRRLVEALAR